MKSFVMISVLAAVALAGCSEAAGPERGSRLSAIMETDGIHVTNAESRTIYVFAIDSELAPRANWTPCVSPPDCISAEPGRTVHIPSSHIAGWGGSDKVLLYWWHLIPSNGGYKVDAIRAIPVPAG